MSRTELSVSLVVADTVPVVNEEEKYLSASDQQFGEIHLHVSDEGGQNIAANRMDFDRQKFKEQLQIFQSVMRTHMIHPLMNNDDQQHWKPRFKQLWSLQCLILLVVVVVTSIHIYNDIHQVQSAVASYLLMFILSVKLFISLIFYTMENEHFYYLLKIVIKLIIACSVQHILPETITIGLCQIYACYWILLFLFCCINCRVCGCSCSCDNVDSNTISWFRWIFLCVLRFILFDLKELYPFGKCIIYVTEYCNAYHTLGWIMLIMSRICPCHCLKKARFQMVPANTSTARMIYHKFIQDHSIWSKATENLREIFILQNTFPHSKNMTGVMNYFCDQSRKQFKSTLKGLTYTYHQTHPVVFTIIFDALVLLASIEGIEIYGKGGVLGARYWLTEYVTASILTAIWPPGDVDCDIKYIAEASIHNMNDIIDRMATILCDMLLQLEDYFRNRSMNICYDKQMYSVYTHGKRSFIEMQTDGKDRFVKYLSRKEAIRVNLTKNLRFSRDGLNHFSLFRVKHIYQMLGVVDAKQTFGVELLDISHSYYDDRKWSKLCYGHSDGYYRKYNENCRLYIPSIEGQLMEFKRMIIESQGDLDAERKYKQRYVFIQFYMGLDNEMRRWIQQPNDNHFDVYECDVCGINYVALRDGQVEDGAIVGSCACGLSFR